MSSADLERLPSRVRAMRGNMHVRAAASEIGISPTTLGKIERGGLPSRTILVKLARWLGESESGLFELAKLDASARPRIRFAPDLAERIIEANERVQAIEARGHE